MTKDIASGNGWEARFEIVEEHGIYGIKDLSYDNFLAPEIGSLCFIPGNGLSTLGPEIPDSRAVRARVEMFTRLALPPDLPETVWRMFEVALGAMVYGLFFYPLFTLGEQHLSRLFEWMIRDRYKTFSGKDSRNLKSMVQWLIANKHFPDQSEVRWLATYEIRNLVAHPVMQEITSPHDAARRLRQTRELALHFYGAAAADRAT